MNFAYTFKFYISIYKTHIINHIYVITSKTSLTDFDNITIERRPDLTNSSYRDGNINASLINTTPLRYEVITRLEHYGRMLFTPKQTTDNK